MVFLVAFVGSAKPEKKERVREFIHCKRERRALAKKEKEEESRRGNQEKEESLKPKKPTVLVFACHIEVSIAPPSFDSCH